MHHKYKYKEWYVVVVMICKSSFQATYALGNMSHLNLAVPPDLDFFPRLSLPLCTPQLE